MKSSEDASFEPTVFPLPYPISHSSKSRSGQTSLRPLCVKPLEPCASCPLTCYRLYSLAQYYSSVILLLPLGVGGKTHGLKCRQLAFIVSVVRAGGLRYFHSLCREWCKLATRNLIFKSYLTVCASSSFPGGDVSVISSFALSLIPWPNDTTLLLSTSWYTYYVSSSASWTWRSVVSYMVD